MTDGVGDEAGVDRLEQLLTRMWPDGAPFEARSLLLGLAPGTRERVLDRLEAVWRAETGEPLGPLAELAGLRRAAFFNLRRAWRSHGVHGVVPNEIGPGRRVTVDDDDVLRARARGLLRAAPGRRNVEVARQLVREGGLTAESDDRATRLGALQRMERLVQHERRDLATDPAFLREGYGGALVLDLTAVSIVVDLGESRRLAVAAMLMDVASGTILGSALGTGAPATVQIAALDDAVGFLANRRADRLDGRAPELAVTLPPGLDAGPIAEKVGPLVAELSLEDAGGFSYGRQAVQLVGPRIGRLVMNPRRTLHIDADKFLQRQNAPVLTPEEAEATWRREVTRHNYRRLDGLKAAGIIDGAGTDGGRLAEVATALGVALRAHCGTDGGQEPG